MSSDVPDQILDHLLNIYATSYDTEITELADNDTDEQQALYIDLSYLDEKLATDFRNEPETLTKFATNALHQYAAKQDIDLGDVNIRLIDTDNTTRIGELRAKHNDSLVTIPGTIRSTSSVTSYPTEAAFQCQRCGTITAIPQPDSIDYENLDEPQECLGCERQGPFKLDKSNSEYIDVQQFRIESTLSDPEIENPESIIAIAKNDIVGTAKPGDSVSITGTVKLLGYGKNRPNLDATVNDKYIDISSINALATGSLSSISQSDVEKFVEESNRSDIYQRIVDSIAPHVPGCEDVKLAVALQLFGGIKKELDDGTTIPGNIHIGIAADPGKFAAEIVDYAAHIAPKSTRVDGTDTSQVGLTTAAYKSKSGTKSWELDAGALVLADNGIACLTQIDQLNDKSQAALFSVMRDQEVKASKGTATQTLPAETSILASMSPKYGRFDQYELLC